MADEHSKTEQATQETVLTTVENRVTRSEEEIHRLASDLQRLLMLANEVQGSDDAPRSAGGGAGTAGVGPHRLRYGPREADHRYHRADREDASAIGSERAECPCERRPDRPRHVGSGSSRCPAWRLARGNGA
jgi:uncharacterized coiled-coil protein SlyX